MTSVTQTIPTLTGGLSQQPDELKRPGQVNVATNVLPDVTYGLLKRPGGDLIASLSNGTLNSYTTGTWFHYYRDDVEQYIGQVIRRNGHADDGKIRMWRCNAMTIDGVDYAAGSEVNVVHAADTQTYLQHTSDEQIQTLTVNDYTYLVNRTKKVEMLTGTSDKEPVRPPEAYVEVKQIAYSRQYAVNLFDNTTTQTTSTATRIFVEQTVNSNGSGYGVSGACNSSGDLPPGGTLPGSSGYTSRCTNGINRDSFCPNVGTEIFSVDHGGSGDQDDANNTSYTFQVTPNGGSAADRKNLYFRIRCTGQSTPEGEDDSPDYVCRYTVDHDLLYGGEGWKTGDYFYVWLNRAKYKVTVQAHSESQVQANLGLIRPEPTSFDTKTTVTLESILGNIRNGILGSSNGGTNTAYQWKQDANNGYEVKQIGSGIYVTRPSSQGMFSIDTPTGDLLNVLTDTVKDIADLPRQCKHGMVVKVKNSENDEDDYYVKFIGLLKDNGNPDNDADYLDGEGTWEECLKPGEEKTFNTSTMPIILIRTSDGNFRVTKVDGSSYNITRLGQTETHVVPAWESAKVGTTVEGGTNPRPSFVGSTINKIVFFRNRLVFLSSENVIMSRPGTFFDFWNKTAIAFSNTDPIDVSCSSEYPADVFDALQVNSGLVMFTRNQQFLLTTDSDILSPLTAKINAVATFNFNPKTNPISLGTTIGFVDNANKFSRLFEMNRVLREGEPDVVEQSKVISTLLPRDLDLIANSRENSIIFLATKDTKDIYGFRYFNTAEKRLSQAWFKWELNENIQYMCFQDDTLVVVTRDNGIDKLLKFSIKLDTNGLFATDTKGTADTSDDVTYRVFLDNAQSFTPVTTGSNANASYSNGITTIDKPNGFTSGTDLVVFNPNYGNDFGRYATATLVNSNTQIQIAGDWTTGNYLIGYLYDMQVELPTIFVTQKSGDTIRSDARSSLILHRIKVNFGSIGQYSTKIKRYLKDDFVDLLEMSFADSTATNRAAIMEEIQRTIPIYEKNTNTTITISSKHPLPATIYSMSWEGDYSNKFYRIV